MWNLAPPPGFQGLHPYKPVTSYQRHLPHLRQEGATYFVTFRLGDSLPQEKLHELNAFRMEWEKRNPEPRDSEATEEYAKDVQRKVEKWLDRGYGCCILRDAKCGKVVANSMHHFDLNGTDCQGYVAADAARYELGCYVVMANHVHAIVRPLDGKLHPLENIIGSWKQFSSGQINKLKKSKGSLWQDEGFDRIIRDEERLWNVVQYIGKNPEKAGLPGESCPLWIRPEWELLGWTFDWCLIP
ncbi:MAG: hypothetical protein O2856_03205 [Planctomycetota bacterium]|nr:hypothetical protein [Planctomycetota bacterium]